MEFRLSLIGEYLLVLLTDITERIRTEAALQASERKYRQITELLPQTVFETDITGTLTFVNQSAYAKFGYTEEDVKKGLNVLTTIAPQDRPLAMENMKRVLRKENRPSQEYRAVDKKGREFPIIIYSSPIEEAGHPVGIRGIVVDISDVRNAQEAQTANDSKFHAIYDQAPHLAGILDLDGTMTDANATARAFIGGAESSFIGKPFWQTPWWSHSPQIQEKLRASIEQAARGELIQFETSHINAAGELRYIDFTLKPVFDQQGKVFCLIPEGRDITGQKQAEAEREHLHSQLLAAQKLESVGRLAGGVAHDFNNMLGAIIGYTELEVKRQAATPHTGPDYLAQILKAARRSAELTRQLLAFARQQPISPIVLDLNKTIENQLEMLRRLAGEEIRLVWLPGHQLWSINIDPSQVSQLLTHLCLNARDAIDGIGQITLQTENVRLTDPVAAGSESSLPAGEYIALTIGDTGRGMAPDMQAHAFEPFYTTKEVGKGTGLGLATVYGIVRQNDGLITLRSAPGQGTQVLIHLPRHRSGSPREKGVKPDSLIEEKRPTILMVEDEPSILEMGGLMLEELGYQALLAASPQEALTLAETHPGPISLLISDVVMPGMNGRDLADRILGIRPHTACLFMSGYPADVIARRGIIHQDTQFIQKPFSLSDLSAKIQSILTRTGR
jgi:PAS domain S-box-containing protein